MRVFIVLLFVTVAMSVLVSAAFGECRVINGQLYCGPSSSNNGYTSYNANRFNNFTPVETVMELPVVQNVIDVPRRIFTAPQPQPVYNVVSERTTHIDGIPVEQYNQMKQGTSRQPASATAPSNNSSSSNSNSGCNCDDQLEEINRKLDILVQASKNKYREDTSALPQQGALQLTKLQVSRSVALANLNKSTNLAAN